MLARCWRYSWPRLAGAMIALVPLFGERGTSPHPPSPQRTQSCSTVSGLQLRQGRGYACRPGCKGCVSRRGPPPSCATMRSNQGFAVSPNMTFADQQPPPSTNDNGDPDSATTTDAHRRWRVQAEQGAGGGWRGATRHTTSLCARAGLTQPRHRRCLGPLPPTVAGMAGGPPKPAPKQHTHKTAPHKKKTGRSQGKALLHDNPQGPCTVLGLMGSLMSTRRLCVGPARAHTGSSCVSSRVTWPVAPLQPPPARALFSSDTPVVRDPCSLYVAWAAWCSLADARRLAGLQVERRIVEAHEAVVVPSGALGCWHSLRWQHWRWGQCT